MQLELLRHPASAEWHAWLLAALLLVFAAALTEAVVCTFRRGGRYDWRALASTLGDVAMRLTVNALGLSLATPLLAWCHTHRLATLAPDSPATVALLFVGQEFCYYWHHRAAHRIRWFWASHCVHHSPNELTLGTALRLGWTGKLTGGAIFFAPLVWLGFHPLVVSAAVALNLLYQFWLHATWIPRLGPLEWVFNTPSHHRVHHASNPAYLDRNYGGVLIVFDRLFGTFAAERDDLPPRYGLTTPVRTYNPVLIALHGWIALASDLAAARSGREACRTLFGPPTGPRTRSTYNERAS